MMKSRILGFTLIELLISIAISLLIIAAVTTMYVSMTRSNIDYLKSIRLNHELRASLNTMARDIRRAGHYQVAATALASGAIPSTSWNPYTIPASTAIRLIPGATPASSAISFSYDRDPTVGVEGYGFRLASGAIQLCSNNSSVCGAAGPWENLTDDALIDVTDLTFDINPYYTGSASSAVSLSLMEVRISVTGRLQGDNEFTRTLSEQVVVRNEQLQ